MNSDTNIVPGINSHHEVYEDLGIHSYSVLDQSFNVNNFPYKNINENDPSRSLSGSVRTSGLARQPSSGRQSPFSIQGLTGSISASPTTPAFQAPFPVIAEKQCTLSGEPLCGYPEVGLRSFSPIIEQVCTDSGEPLMPSAQEKSTTQSGDLNLEDFQFPTWDQLPAHFQNPTSSADYNSTIPISITGVSMPAMEGTIGNGPMTWDDTDLNFAMDMDLDFDFDLNVPEN